MLIKLSNKLIVTLFILLLMLSTGFIGFSIWSTPKFLQELNQQLNLDLAANIVREKTLIVDHQVNNEALQAVFMGLMVVNPIIEVYLLDPSGKVLAYSAPEGAVRRNSIDPEPVRQFIAAETSLPILGNDPRDPQRNKVFSAAPIYQSGNLQGYLYIVLGGQHYDSVVELLESSHVLRLWAGAIGINLLIVSLAGFLVFRHITRRLRQLTRVIDQFKQENFRQAIPLPHHFRRLPGDEINQLAITFSEMSERIMQQVGQLEHIDNSRRELVANVSHDLRTPLTSLQGYLETLSLKKDQLKEEEKQDYIRIALQHCEHLRRLISELFELSTLEAGDTELHREPFSMSELTQDISQKYQLDARNRNLQLVADIPRQAAFVSADIGLIQRVLDNLIENAIKFTPAGGRIDIRLLQHRNSIETSVSDTGPGIPAENLSHIFERFYRADKQRNIGGTGLGLAIARQIMELHHSTIQVNSAPDRGTTFSFHLPCAEARG